MLRTGIATLLHEPRIIIYESIRGVRGGVTIPVKVVNPVAPPKPPKHSFSSDKFKDLRHTNRGAAHILRSRADLGYEDSEFRGDAEDLHDTEVDMDDAKGLFLENRSQAEKRMWEKKFHNVKRKHFKSPQHPNMLTYIEKQQMKNLNKKDPDTWNAEKLASCYPATPEIVKKVLKSRFTASNVKNVLKHDETVRQNWELFKQKKLHIDENLAAHYAGFLGRENAQPNPKEIEKFLPSPPEFCTNLSHNEFGSIIASSKKYRLLAAKKRKQVELDSQGYIVYAKKAEELQVIDEETATQGTKTHHTLEDFRNQLNANALLGEYNVDTVITNQDPKKRLGKVTEDAAPDYDYLSDPEAVNKHLESNLFKNRNDHVPLRIRIPASLRCRGEGKKYRVADCFYDEDGYFLYRVPGLF